MERPISRRAPSRLNRAAANVRRFYRGIRRVACFAGIGAGCTRLWVQGQARRGSFDETLRGRLRRLLPPNVGLGSGVLLKSSYDQWLSGWSFRFTSTENQMRVGHHVISCWASVYSGQINPRSAGTSRHTGAIQGTWPYKRPIRRITTPGSSRIWELTVPACDHLAVAYT